MIWQPGLTFWIAAWGAEKGQSAEGTLAWLVESASPDRQAEQVDHRDGLIRLTYQLPEHDPDRSPPEYVEISGYVISDEGHVQISAYCDNDAALKRGYSVIESMQPVA